MKRIDLSGIAVVILSSIAFTQSYAEEAECQEKYIETIYISNVSVQNKDDDFSRLADLTTEKIKKVADELALKDFELTMTDVSASRNSYTMTKYDYNASYTMTFQMDKRAFGTFLQKLTPLSISSSIVKHECT
jgi:hypothetical protein